jgi:hypothetical protein
LGAVKLANEKRDDFSLPNERKDSERQRRNETNRAHMPEKCNCIQVTYRRTLKLCREVERKEARMQNNRERSAELAAAPGSAKFLPDGEGHSLRSDEGEVAVWSGKTTDTGQECYAVKMPHKSGNKHIFLLSRARATLLGNLLLTAINRNSQNEKGEPR